MINLKEFAMSYKAKKELWDLDKIPANIEIHQSSFKNAEGKELAYNYIEIDGYRYTIKSKIISQIKIVLENRPQTTAIKIKKSDDGQIYVVPLD